MRIGMRFVGTRLVIGFTLIRNMSGRGFRRLLCCHLFNGWVSAGRGFKFGSQVKRRWAGVVECCSRYLIRSS